MTRRKAIIIAVCLTLYAVLVAASFAFAEPPRLMRVPSIPPAFIAADVNGDQIVNGGDIAALFAQWGPCNLVVIQTCSADVTGDGVVDGADLSQVLALFGKAWARHDYGTGALYMPTPGARAQWIDSPFPGYRRLSVFDGDNRARESVDQQGTLIIETNGAAFIGFALLALTRRITIHGARKRADDALSRDGECGPFMRAFSRIRRIGLRRPRWTGLLNGRNSATGAESGGVSGFLLEQ